MIYIVSSETLVFDMSSLPFQFLAHVEEAEWAIQAMKETKLPVACTLRMGPTGDLNNISPGECAVRMAKAGRPNLDL